MTNSTIAPTFSFELVTKDSSGCLARHDFSFQSIEELKKKPAQPSGASTTSKDKKPQPPAKSAEKKQDDPKEKKSDASKKSAEPNPNSNKNKGGAAAAPAAAAKPYFTAGAEGDSEHSYRTLDTLIGLFEQAIRKAYPQDATFPVLVVPGRQTDYQCNSAMPIAQKLGLAGTKVAPTDVAKTIVASLPQHDMISKVRWNLRIESDEHVSLVVRLNSPDPVSSTSPCPRRSFPGRFEIS